MMKRILLIALLVVPVASISQIIVDKPFAAEQSHPELSVDKITFYVDSTVVNLTVVNKLEQGGWFCADKNIYIENPYTRQRYHFLGRMGYQTVPKLTILKKKNDTLSFTLVFQPAPADLRTINLVENCEKACFNFKGIILDAKLNADIRTFNRGMEFYTSNKIDDAVACFIKVLEEIPAFPTHVYGYAFYHLVVIHQNKNDNLAAKYWLARLESSQLPDKQYFIEAIRKSKDLPK